MDLEKMQRINALAKELKNHGIVEDFDEAYKKAEQMIEKNLSIDDVEEEKITKKIQVEEAVNEEVQAQPIISQASVGVDALDIKNIHDKIKGLEGQMSQVFTKMNEMIAEINRIDKKKKESPIEVKEEQEAQAQLKDEKIEPHPRTGDYKPDDVSIEKMFYFGGS